MWFFSSPLVTADSSVVRPYLMKSSEPAYKKRRCDKPSSVRLRITFLYYYCYFSREPPPPNQPVERDLVTNSCNSALLILSVTVDLIPVQLMPLIKYSFKMGLYGTEIGPISVQSLQNIQSK